MNILAIDPGTTQSGWVVFRNGKVDACGVDDNAELLARLHKYHDCDLAIEWIESQGMAVGKETFITVRWIGRFMQAWRDPEAVRMIPRRAVKLHLCGSMKAKDKNIRQALLDVLGPQGTKKSPGPTYGVSSHAWQALAVAATAAGLQPKPF